MAIQYFVYSFIKRWTFELFQIFDIMNNVAKTFECKFYCEHLFSVLWDVHVGVEFPDHVTVLCLIFLGTDKLFP
jgi:hypothetical protein